MKVKIKRLRPDAVIPRYAKNGDAGFDLTAVSGDTFEAVVTVAIVTRQSKFGKLRESTK